MNEDGWDALAELLVNALEEAVEEQEKQKRSA